MSSGNSLACTSERTEIDANWISVPVPPEMVYALALGDSDGLAVMDGGNPANENNYFYSAQSEVGHPILVVRLGGGLRVIPPDPDVSVAPPAAPGECPAGVIRLSIAPTSNVFLWRIWIDAVPAPRWQVKHPVAEKPTLISLEGLEPGVHHVVEVVGVSIGGQTTSGVRLKTVSSLPLKAQTILGAVEPFSRITVEPIEDRALRVCAVPGLVKINPVAGEVMSGDLGVPGSVSRAMNTANSVWDGRQVRLFGARGEYVSFQLCLENASRAPLAAIDVEARAMKGPAGATIPPADIELFSVWYAKNRRGQWQPAYCVPIERGATLALPQSANRLPDQRNQMVYVDLYIPKDAKAGDYSGAIAVHAGQNAKIEIPVNLEVLNFSLPDRLSFRPELNAYRIPPRAQDYYRLAHQHRCVLNCWAWRPQVSGSGASIQVDWSQYDNFVGPLLTGQAFAANRRAGVPVECMYLPFEDSWPTPLSEASYAYHGAWPRQGDPLSTLVTHYLTAPPIERGLSDQYRDAFWAVQREFIEHFQQKGYTKTEMQCYFGGKAINRINYGTNVWWTTDEPYYWDDWSALHYFLELWTKGHQTADRRLWPGRADISRPQWQGRTLDGLVDALYVGAGGFTGPAMVRRARTIAQETGASLRVYGATSADDASNMENVSTLLTAWANGGRRLHALANPGPRRRLGA